MLQPGDKLPDFSLLQTDGSLVRSSSFRGRKVVLYFYPKDDTPGCTKEACSIRDSWAKLREKQVMVYGISPDAVTSHHSFATKYNLPFSLLSDPDHNVAQQFGIWVEKNRFGKKAMGIARTTFIVGEAGTITDVITDVNTDTHAEQLLERL